MGFQGTEAEKEFPQKANFADLTKSNISQYVLHTDE
jgi:hypothetical protein